MRLARGWPPFPASSRAPEAGGSGAGSADGMAGAPGAAGQASPEQLAPEQPQQGFLARFLADDQKCQLMLLKTLQTSRSRREAGAAGGAESRGSGSAPGRPGPGSGQLSGETGLGGHYGGGGGGPL